jgi:hypothetical protein
VQLLLALPELAACGVDVRPAGATEMGDSAMGAKLG